MQTNLDSALSAFSLQTTPAQNIRRASGQNETETDSQPETAKSGTKSTPETATYEDDPKIKEMITKLQARDAKVRAHEAAHIAAGGGVVTGGASFTYQQGPDQKMYAIGGEVPIDTSKEPDPDATMQKAQKIKAAALAPADPSSADLKIAATASMMESKAMQEKRLQERENGDSDTKKDDTALNVS